MKNVEIRTKVLLAIPAVIATILVCSGCPTDSGATKAQLTTVFTADGAPLVNTISEKLLLNSLLREYLVMVCIIKQSL